MVYIHIKKVGNKKYYTLRLSVRKDGKILTKDLENLGSDITKIKIENLTKKYHQEIRKSYRTLNRFLESNYYLEKIKEKKLKKNEFFSKKQLEEIEAAHLHFEKKFMKLDKLTIKEYYEAFLIKFAVSSTSIEGNTITLEQAEMLLMENIAPKDKTLREIYDLQNTKNVFFNLLEKMPNLSLRMIEEVHDKLLENIDIRKGYRTDNLRILGQPFKPSPGQYVKNDMKMLIDWYKRNEKKMHPLALAIFFHHKFENIHPFYDGNGRTGRIIMNHILIKSRYPPLIVPVTFRKEYLDLMSEADKAMKNDILGINMDYYKNLFSFIVDQFSLTYWNNFLF